MSTRQIHVFISHSWSYTGHYNTLADWIFDQKWHVGQASLDMRNYSVPKYDPIVNVTSDRLLRDAIYTQISRSHVVVIPTGMYVHYSKWIQKEIEGARLYEKPILAVNPWGQLRKASVVAIAATQLCGWNAKSVVNGIWSLFNR